MLRQSYGMPAGTLILDYKTGDVNGDGIMDQIYLTGQKTNISEYYMENIRILAVDGRTNIPLEIPLKNASGYGAKLFLGPFSSMRKLDMLVSIDSGGSGGYISAYLYSIYANKPVLLLDSDIFNSNSIYNAVFKDNFKVEVTGAGTNIKFIIDISGNRKMYIDTGIYSKNGRLLKPTEGGVLALGALYPLVPDFDGLYRLLAYQRIIGINNADNLGAVQTYLKWDGKRIVTDRVGLALMPV